jgi:transcription elongation factor GreA
MAAILRDMEQLVEHPEGTGAARAAASELEPQTPPPAIITRDGARALQARVQRLRHQLDVEFADRLNEARGFGEIGGNDDYLQALEEQAVLTSRLSRLQRLLDSAAVVEQEPASNEAAAVGTAVEVEDLSSGVVREHRLVGDYESRDTDAVSASSPIGRAVIGHRPGDQVEVELPRGRTQHLRVLSVRADV